MCTDPPKWYIPVPGLCSRTASYTGPARGLKCVAQKHNPQPSTPSYGVGARERVGASLLREAVAER